MREAVESVLSQDYPDFEHIVADGGSTDGTLEMLAEYPHLTVISEPDEGLYDALNKAVALTTGEIIGHINSDDLYAPGALHKVAEAFSRTPELDMVAGGATVFEDEPGGRRTVADFPGRVYGPLTLEQVTVGVPIINARFFHRRVYDTVGHYQQRYSIAADREFLLRVCMSEAKGTVIDDTLYLYRQHEGSLTIQANSTYALKRCDQYLDICAAHGGPDSPSAVRAACARWYDVETINATLEAVRLMQPGQVAHFAMRGWRHNLLWPVTFIAEVSRRLLRRITGGKK
jgi:glycosyltransferase involved in cell wall biosynthesis